MTSTTKARSKKTRSARLARPKVNPLVAKLLQKQQATLDRLDVLLNGEFAIIEPSRYHVPEDGSIRDSHIELYNLELKIDLRKDIAQQVSDNLGELIRVASQIKRRIDRAIRAGEFPRPAIKNWVWVGDDGKVLKKFDDPHFAALHLQHGGDVLNEFADGTTEPSENGWVYPCRKRRESEAAKAG